jgi:uncharacterized protein (TIGR00369 family)
MSLPKKNSQARHSSPSTIDEQSNHCFGCGPANPQGLHLSFTISVASPENPVATAQVQLTRLHEGPPGYIHGGIIATLLDEAMSKLNRPLNVLAVTRHMEIDYLRPAPVHEPLLLVGHHIRREGRKLFHQAEIQQANGTVIARAKGVFIVLDEKVLATVLRAKAQN